MCLNIDNNYTLIYVAELVNNKFVLIGQAIYN